MHQDTSTFGRRLSRRLALLVAGGLTLGAWAYAVGADAAGPCDAPTATWDGGAGTTAWTTPANWAGDVLPSEGAVVCIPAAAAGASVSVSGTVPALAGLDSQKPLTVSTTLELDGASSVAGLTLTGGGLSGTGTVTLTGTSTWSGGDMTGAGTTLVAPGATFHVPGSGGGTLHGRTLRNDGTISLDGPYARIYGGSGAVIDNRGTLTAVELTTLYGAVHSSDGSQTPMTLRNTGTVSVSTGTSSASWSELLVDNDGVLRAPTGTLSLGTAATGSPTSSGAFGTTGGGVVQLTGGELLLGAGASLGGASVQGAEVVVPSGVRVVGTDVTLASGSIGGAGTFAMAGSSSWSGGDMVDAGTTEVVEEATLTVPGSGGGTLRTGRTLENRGTFALSGQYARVYGGDGAVLHNAGTMTAAELTTVYGAVHTDGTGSPMLLRNTGTISVDAGDSSASWSELRVDNDGSLTTTAGTLSLGAVTADPPTSTGSFGASGTGTTGLTSGRLVLGQGASFAGASVSGATVEVPSGVTVPGHLRLTGGAVAGAGTLQLSGASTWSGGDMVGPGTTEVLAGATLDLPANGGGTLGSGRVLVNRGATALSGAYARLYGGDGARIDNHGSLSFVGLTTLYGAVHRDGTGEAMTVHNQANGTITMAGADGDDTASWSETVVENDGVVRTASGTLSISAVQSDEPPVSSGSFVGTPTAVTRLSSGNLALGTGAVLDGVHLSGADLDVASGQSAVVRGARLTGGRVGGAGDLTVAGTTEWTGAAHDGSGTTTIVSGATLSVPQWSAHLLRGGRTMVNRGTIELGLNGSLYGGEDAVLRNEGTVALQDGSGIHGTVFSSLSQPGPLELVNTGTVSKTSGTSGALVSADVRNDGTFRSTSGDLQVQPTSDSPVSTGVFAAVAPANVSFNGDVRLGDGARLEGLTVERGRVLADGTVTAAGLRLAGGELSGTGDLVVENGLTVTGGTMSGRGATVVPPGETLTLAGDSWNGLALRGSRILSTAGQVDWTGGWVDVSDGAFVDNSGTWEITGNGSMSGSWGDDVGLFYNGGTLRKAAGEETAIGIPVENDGAIRASGAGLHFDRLLNFSGGTLARGTYVVEAGGTLGLSGAVTTNAANVVVDGATSRFVSSWSDGAGSTALAHDWHNAPAGRVTVRGGASLSVGSLINSGTLRVGAGSALNAAGGYVQRAGSTVVEATSTLFAADGQQIELRGGALSGTGTAGPALLVTGGRVSPAGGDVGTLSVAGDVTFASGATLQSQVSQTGADVLDASGSVAVSGTLHGLVSGTAPTTGVASRVLRAAAVTGQFTDVVSTGLADGLAFAASYPGTAVDLTVEEVADSPAVTQETETTTEEPSLQVLSVPDSASPGPAGDAGAGGDDEAVTSPATASEQAPTADGPVSDSEISTRAGVSDVREAAVAALPAEATAAVGQAAGSRAVRSLVVQRAETAELAAAAAAAAGGAPAEVHEDLPRAPIWCALLLIALWAGTWRKVVRLGRRG